MKTFQKRITDQNQISEINLNFEPDLILLFVSPDFPLKQETLKDINIQFPNTNIVGCSTSGEIHDIQVTDKSLIFNALAFQKTPIKKAIVNIKDYKNSHEAGLSLFENLNKSDLKHIILLSDGLLVKGDELLDGLSQNMPEHISITGGLAGDGPDFNKTFIIDQDQIISGGVVAIGLYGDAINIGYGSKGGWDSFGIERKVTKSKENIIYELDGQPALSLYKSYLGEKAKDLPSSGLLFPLSMRSTQNKKPVVRTILSIDEETNSLTFAGNIPKNSYVRLMKANIDRLINGAEDSAKIVKEELLEEANFALLISCVGRRLVLKQSIEEEIEVVRNVLGDKPLITGFYSYGELAPFEKGSVCELHNQTMTITTLNETL